MNPTLFKKTILHSIQLFLFFLVFFFLGRLIFLLTYADFTEIAPLKIDLIKAFWVGTRFDVSAILYGFLPLILLWLGALFIPKEKTEGYLNFYRVFTKYYLLVVLIAFLALVLIDFFFYRMFQTRIDVIFFGIFHDDTVAVLHSVWTDYPVIKIILLFIGTGFLFSFFHKKIKWGKSKWDNIPINAWLFFLILPLYLLGMRGSTGIFPLQREDTNVSSNTFINALCYNPLYSLKYAYKEAKLNEIDPDIPHVLEINHFSSYDEAKALYLKDSGDLFDENLFTKTPYNSFLEENPPHVIVLQMESMSAHYFDLHAPDFNLIGELADELPDLYLFNNALSGSNGTIYSLESLLIGTPRSIIAQSIYYNTPFSSSVALPFKEKNYHTSFVTGSKLSWRNIDNFIKFQGYDELAGMNAITQKYTDAETMVWGVHDEYMFRYIEDYLKEHQEQPQYIYGMSVSNHSPYNVPLGFTPEKITIPDSLRYRFRVDEELALGNFTLHQYAATHLARFIKRIKASPLGENTIIVATGDHNTKMVFSYNDQESFDERGVPIILYIPEKYKPQWVDQNIYTSHKDIFPTLYNLSLSDAAYYYTGDNMFDSTVIYRHALNGFQYVADEKGVLVIQNYKPLYYQWKEEGSRQLVKGDDKAEHAQYMLDKLRAYNAMETIHIFQDIHRNLEKKAK